MSLSVTGVGTVSILFPPSSGTLSYGQNASATSSASGTTLGSEAGAAAVVYAPSPVDAVQPITYPQPDQASRIASRPEVRTLRVPASPPDQASSSGDAAIVEAGGGRVHAPQQGIEASSDVRGERVADAFPLSVRPAMPDVAGAIANGQGAPPMQSEVSAQAVYAMVANASLEGASLADLPKFA